MAKHLTDLHGNLGPIAQDASVELQDLCSKCSNTAQQLCTEVQKLKVNGPHRKREAVVKTVKAMWKKGAIEDLQKQLDGYQKLLDSNILVDLRFVHHQSLFPFRDVLAGAHHQRKSNSARENLRFIIILWLPLSFRKNMLPGTLC